MKKIVIVLFVMATIIGTVGVGLSISCISILVYKYQARGTQCVILNYTESESSGRWWNVSTTSGFGYIYEDPPFSNLTLGESFKCYPYDLFGPKGRYYRVCSLGKVEISLLGSGLGIVGLGGFLLILTYRFNYANSDVSDLHV